MTDEELKVIEARADAATEGPWSFDPNNPGLTAPNGELVAARYTQPNFENDCRFIAHSRLDVPALVAEVRRLRRLHALEPTAAGPDEPPKP